MITSKQPAQYQEVACIPTLPRHRECCRLLCDNCLPLRGEHLPEQDSSASKESSCPATAGAVCPATAGDNRAVDTSQTLQEGLNIPSELDERLLHQATQVGTR